MRYGGMEVIDCNNHVKSTIKYFGPSCAVNSLIDKYNPLGKFIVIEYIGIFRYYTYNCYNHSQINCR